MKTFISLSGGVESTTMCLLYGKNATAIWADTGAEHDEMYARIDYLERVFTEMHEGFSLVRVKARTSAYGKVWDKDGVIRVFADSESQARNFIVMHVGLLWSNQEARIDLSHYPKGIIADVFLTVPSMKDFGYQEAQGFDEEGGWEIEGGEEAYEEAIEKYIAVGQNQFISGL